MCPTGGPHQQSSISSPRAWISSMRATRRSGARRLGQVEDACDLVEAALPELPTMTDAGYPDVYLDVWFGLVGPAGLPEPIVGIVRERILAILHAREMSGKISQPGWLLTTSTPDEFRDLMRSEIVRIGKVLKAAVTDGR